MRFPLWVKLGALFGGLSGLAIGIYGYLDFQDLVRQEAADRQEQMLDLAVTLARGLDGEVHRSFRHEDDRSRPTYQQARAHLQALVEDSELVTWAASSAPDARGHWVYVVDGSVSGAPFPIGFPVFDGTAYRREAFTGEPQYVEALEDEFGRWHTAFAPILDSRGQPVGVLEIVADADTASLLLQSRGWRLVGSLALAIAGGFLASFLFGRLLSRHLGELVLGVRRVASGELHTRVYVATNDELGVLASAFNQMVEGLQEREFIRDTFGRFVNPDVVSAILADRRRLALGGEARTVTVLMSDLRGFTSLSEELGPERMVALLNRYLSRMTAVVERYEGNVAELLGDGIVVLFGAPIARPDDARRALACAVAMQQELVRFNREEGRTLSMGVGIDTGVVIAGNIGSEQHMKYGVVGEAINLAARLEGFTLGNQVLISESTLRAAGDEVEVDALLELRAKGRRLPLRCYPLLGLDGQRMPEAPQAEHVETHLPAVVWRVEGKEVHHEAHAVLVVRVDAHSLVLRGDLPVEARDGVKLAVDVEGRALEDLYATVAQVDGDAVTVLLTAVPAEARDVLEQFVSERTDEATA